jgi:hypothetical protein
VKGRQQLRWPHRGRAGLGGYRGSHRRQPPRSGLRVAAPCAARLRRRTSPSALTSAWQRRPRPDGHRGRSQPGYSTHVAQGDGPAHGLAGAVSAFNMDGGGSTMAGAHSTTGASASPIGRRMGVSASRRRPLQPSSIRRAPEGVPRAFGRGDQGQAASALRSGGSEPGRTSRSATLPQIWLPRSVGSADPPTCSPVRLPPIAARRSACRRRPTGRWCRRRS